QAMHAHLDAAETIAIEMDFLPLALDQAGAYIEEVGCSLSSYLELYQTHRKHLLHRRGHVLDDHPESVATTWSLSFQKIEQTNPAAAALLRFCAFLEPDTIPEELINEGSAHLGPILGLVATDALKVDDAIQELRAFSLIQRDPDARILRVHRLVQAVLKDTMHPEEQSQWAERAVQATNALFPNTVEFATWPRCRRVLPQAQACSVLIQAHALAFPEAASLLYRTACYVDDFGLYEQAEPLLQHAVRFWEHALGPEHPTMAHALTRLAHLYREQGKYKHAEPLYQRALSIWEQALGPEHPDVATALNGLAVLYQVQAKYEQAEPLFQRAVRIQEHALGSEHPDVALSLNHLATLFALQGKYEHAEPLYQRALSIWEQALGPEHPHVAASLHALATLYHKQGKYEYAEPLYQRALSIW
nr:tetratricopeptide repeat protein [Chloroflexota bacterium]